MDQIGYKLVRVSLRRYSIKKIIILHWHNNTCCCSCRGYTYSRRYWQFVE